MDLLLIHSKPNQTSGPLQLGKCKMSCNGFFLTVRGNFPCLPLFPSPFAQAVLPWAQVSLLLVPSSLQCSVPQQLLLCIISQ